MLRFSDSHSIRRIRIRVEPDVYPRRSLDYPANNLLSELSEPGFILSDILDYSGPPQEIESIINRSDLIRPTPVEINFGVKLLPNQFFRVSYLALLIDRVGRNVAQLPEISAGVLGGSEPPTA